jgi:hypothetical protein
VPARGEQGWAPAGVDDRVLESDSLQQFAYSADGGMQRLGAEVHGHAVNLGALDLAADGVRALDEGDLGSRVRETDGRE